MQEFGPLLKRWRSARHLSQLQLAGEADVSARHISFLESGRARPSRDMVLRLAETLSVPLTDRNGLLETAGFAPQYRSTPLDEPMLAQIRAATQRLMTGHDPFPAVLLDRDWTLVDLNATAAKLFALSGLSQGDSILAPLLAGKGPELIENWGEVGHHLVKRLRNESRAAGGDHRLDRAAAQLAQDPAVRDFVAPAPLPPIVSTIYRAGPMRLALFSTFVQFSGAEDIALADLKIELMFPADDNSRVMLETMG